ncbi:MAG: Zn-ribbon domain-containing OB-fold protein [Chloroflexi bacterium]|nr:MAG: Zn-ribbon domain-containing OB-fold protein [Chloroflexota bacterium]
MSAVSNPVHLSTEQYTFSGTGEVYSYTTVLDPPAGFEDQAPYVLALVKLDEGPIVTAQITDLDGSLDIGDRVEMVTRKLTTEGPQGMIVYGYKFRKVLQQS